MGAAAAWLELRCAVIGSLLLARGDPAGLDYFDRSHDGFWRSFRAAVLVYPLFLVLLAIRANPARWEAAGGWFVVAIESIGYVIGWTIFPLVMIGVTRWLGREPKYYDFMVAYNWCQLPEGVLAVVVAVVTQAGILPGAAGRTVEITAGIAVLVYEWFIARSALQTSRSAAAFVVLVDVVLGAMVGRASANFYSG
jgi:hypothetical protein